MKRFFAVLTLSLFTSGSALACEDGKCNDKNCKMQHAEAAATALPADGTRVKLTVSGMSCGACADKVRTALIGVKGVKGALVDAQTGVAEVAYDEKATNTEKLLAAVAATGSFTAAVKTN